jgi:transketolase
VNTLYLSDFFDAMQIFNHNLFMSSIRQVVAQKLYEYVKSDVNVIALTADLSSSVGFDPIKNDFPNQFIQCGIAEQEMMSLSAGLALSGKKPFAASYAQFHPGRNWDQLRTSVCYNNAPVRLISSHYGLSVGGDGATHQSLEYLALTLPLPNISIFLPFNTKSAVWSLTNMYNQNSHPSILFQPRENQSEEIDKVDCAQLDSDGFVYHKSDQNIATNLIITGGLIASEAYKTKKSGNSDFLFLVALTNINELPLMNIFKNYTNIIVVEEHQEFGGLGSLVSQISNRHGKPTSFKHLAIKKQFGKSALSGEELWKKYSIDVVSIETLLQTLS